MNVSAALEAMRAESVPEGWSGLWLVKKLEISGPTLSERHGKPVLVQPGVYTFLHRLTDGTLHHEPPGVTVMEDTRCELVTHLDFVLRARGKVLVTGLGLGCVVRGLLANPAVEHVTCIENSPDVLRLVGPYMPKERLTIIQADALEWTALNTEKFDCAWHDLWTDRAAGEPLLDFWHVRLIMNCRRTVKQQGAWGFDRLLRRRLGKYGIQWIG